METDFEELIDSCQYSSLITHFMMDVETKFMNDNINDADVISYYLVRPRACVITAMRHILSEDAVFCSWNGNKLSYAKEDYILLSTEISP